MPDIETVTPYDEVSGPMEVEVELEEGDLPILEDAPVEEEEPGHTANLAKFIEEDELNTIGTDLIDCFERDDKSREDWLKTYTDGLDYLGFKSEDRSTPFKGASGVHHPVLAEAVVRFQSNAIIEIFPAAGPVLTRMVGAETDEKVEQAKRVKEELNYQLTENMREFRSEVEKLLFRLPLAGSVFKKTYYDPLRGRPCSMMVPAEDFVIDSEASSIESAERYCHILRRTENEYKKLVRSGFYISQELGTPTQYIYPGQQKENEVIGKSSPADGKHPHTFLEFHVNYNLPAPFDDPDGIADPYIITIDRDSHKVLSIYRNWKEDDNDLREPCEYFTHYQYMPGLGFYGFGLIHLLGSIAKSATSILRQLIDAGTLSNLPGGLKTRGLRTKGGDVPVQPGEWRDVEVPAGKISDNLFPLPYHEPSAVLHALLGNLVEEGRRIGSIADIEVGNVGADAPVGTTLALMERSLKVMSAVHARLHAGLRKEFSLISYIIHYYMDEKYEWDEEGKYNRTQDFDGRVDVIPVSDPNSATQAQRIVQTQAVMQLAQQNPELYNLKELHRTVLQAIGIKDDERILPKDEDPPRLDPIQENMRLLTSQPVKVYPDQDHSAHLQVHLNAMLDPKIMELVGQSPNAARLQGQMEAHIAEHLAHQYRSEIEETMGVALPPIGEDLPPDVEARLSRLVAEASSRLREEHKKEVERKQAEEVAADPLYQLREREVAMKERETAHKMDLQNRDFIVDIAKTVAKEMLDMRRIESEETRAGAKIGADLVTFGAQLESEERREGVTLGKEIAENIRADQRDDARMAEEARQRAADRAVAAKKVEAEKAARAANPKKDGK